MSASQRGLIFSLLFGVSVVTGSLHSLAALLHHQDSILNYITV